MAACAYKITDDGIDLAVRLTPKGGRDSVDGIATGANGRVWLAVRVTVPPDSGQANRALIKLLAKRVGIAQSAITLVAGETQRLKRLRLNGDPRALAQAIDALSRDSD